MGQGGRHGRNTKDGQPRATVKPRAKGGLATSSAMKSVGLDDEQPNADSLIKQASGGLSTSSAMRQMGVDEQPKSVLAHSTTEQREALRRKYDIGAYGTRNGTPEGYTNEDSGAMHDMVFHPEEFWNEPEPSRRSNRFSRNHIYTLIEEGKLDETFTPGVENKVSPAEIGALMDVYDDLIRVRGRFESGAYDDKTTLLDVSNFDPRDTEAFASVFRQSTNKAKKERKQTKASTLYKIKKALMNFFGYLTDIQKKEKAEKEHRKLMERHTGLIDILGSRSEAEKLVFQKQIEEAKKKREEEMAKLETELAVKYGANVKFVNPDDVSKSDIDDVIKLQDYAREQLELLEKSKQELATTKKVAEAIKELRNKRILLDMAQSKLIERRLEDNLQESVDADINVRAELGLEPEDNLKPLGSVKSEGLNEAQERVLNPRPEDMDSDIQDIVSEDDEDEDNRPPVAPRLREK